MRAHAILSIGACAAIAACSGGGQQGSGGATTTASSSTTTASSSSTGGTTTSASSSSGAGGATTTTSASGGTGGVPTTSSSSTSASSSSGAGGASGLLSDLAAGPWLFGWSGGLDHFSWVRFNFVTATQGSVDVLDAQCGACIGYWPCEGQGLFAADDTTSSVILQLPQGCNNIAHDLVFTGFMQPSGFFPQATEEASVTDDGQPIMGALFPPSQCDALFKTCSDPFQ